MGELDNVAAEATQELVAKLTGVKVAGRRGPPGGEGGAPWLRRIRRQRPSTHATTEAHPPAGEHHEAPAAFGMTAPMFIALAMIVVWR